MWKNFKIGVGFKITALVIAVVLISVMTVSYIAFNLSERYLEERYRESIAVVAGLKTQKIEAFFDKIRANILFGSRLKAVRNKLSAYSSAKNTPQNLPKDSIPTRKNITKVNLTKANDSIQPIDITAFLGEDSELEDLVDNVLKTYEIKNIYLTDREGKVLYNRGRDESPSKNGEAFPEEDDNTILIGRDSVYLSRIFPRDGDFLMHVSAPVKSANSTTLGIIIYEIRLNYIHKLIHDTTGLGKTGEILLVRAFDNEINHLFVEDANTNSNRRVYKGVNPDKQMAVQNAVKQEAESDFISDIDYRGIPVLATWKYIPVIDSGIIVKIDKSEIATPTNNLFFNLLITGLIVFLISLLIGISFSRQTLIRPLILLKDIVNLLSQGALPDKMPKTTQGKDEIGEMSGKLKDLVDTLKTKASFARSIGQGNLEAGYDPASEKDSLGLALLRMRENIQQSAQRDDERNWIVKGLAEIGDILPSIATIEELGDLVTEFVTKKIGSVQGAFYVVNDENPHELFLEMTASYAYNKRKYLKARFRFAEGLIGQAAVEKDKILRTEIPDDYMTITSGILGDKKPRCILVTPLITNETVFGVLEFAGFKKFEPREIEFVTEISELIARTVFNIKVKENTERLLRESQKISRELQANQEVLRQNAHVMEEQKGELERTNRELQTNIREVQRANDRIQLLLENASEIITIYEPDATIRYISPSVTKILGYTPEEMIGIKDIIYVHPAGVEAYESLFKALLENPTERASVQYSYQAKWGERIWLETTGTNLLADPAIQGLLLNTRDITERRAAEKEQRLRGQMQALSENSPDLITRITKEGQIFYINPIIETYTGQKKEEFLQKTLHEVELGESILSSWQNIVKEVQTKNQKMNMEMDFPSVMGDRVMTVNAIPEYSDHNNLESILLVSHDITERKIIEMEISQKSRKITESINYAKRIQEAILPDTNYIRQFFKNSFILYKPRDVVSGDFPWFLHKGDELFIAAVDCTGHGVPGALISLIGFFLLNNIVNQQQASSSGAILDLLDQDVTRTLKQGEGDAAAKDGMDISLCKINQKRMQIEYAGAHRPLYYMSEGELLEIRGNKFPIGGGQYKNRSKFTNTVINYLDGDSVYLFSDGFPDQFGGPKNKKLSPRKIREIIVDNGDADLSEINRIMDKEFENWKGNNKQTDDVLMIGMKF
jgi:PAS domain S-box-containing protein